ncbi:MAG: cobalt-precorrin-5B (C(1))-methyltransferase [Gemmataceae bacterium]|nr:cobalt-precorrin-5B (C(1))-methyltransferase [Gemmataceae bacterium]
MSRAPFRIVRGHTVPPRNPQGRREGFTTGTAAAAAAKAACLLLLDREVPECVSIQLPIPRILEIRINTVEYESELARCGVIKDAGDDPDVTHGAEICARVRQVPEPGIHIKGGLGVGVVTQRGLELPVGSPAINPVPQRMIRQAIAEVIGSESPHPGIEATISVPNGEELARRTFNARIGIIGGISILGTTGIVRAMSTAAWRASVYQAIDVAAANSVEHIVLSTGGRTEKFAQARYPRLPEMAFVEMGIFTGACMQRAAERGLPRVSICCMIGKLSKIAAGKLQTHVAGNQVDCAFLSQVARELAAPDDLVDSIAQANTARHVQELVEAAGFPCFYTRLCEQAAVHCAAAAKAGLEVEVVLFDFDGRVLGQAQWPAT